MTWRDPDGVVHAVSNYLTVCGRFVAVPDSPEAPVNCVWCAVERGHWALTMGTQIEAYQSFIRRTYGKR